MPALGWPVHFISAMQSATPTVPEAGGAQLLLASATMAEEVAPGCL